VICDVKVANVAKLCRTSVIDGRADCLKSISCSIGPDSTFVFGMEVKSCWKKVAEGKPPFVD
jgi:hypothetical protein